MPNSLLTPTAVTREALRVLHQKLNFIGSITRDYDSSFAKTGAKIGDSLKIRLPNQYVVRTGAALATQDTTETSVSLQVATQKGVDLNFTSVDLTLSLDDFSKRIINPAMSVLAANIEVDAMSMYKDVYQSMWNGGAALTYNNVLDGGVLLKEALTPANDRTANLTPRAMADMVKDTKTLFNEQNAVGKQYREGYMGRAAGFDFVENTMWPSHVRGAANGAYTTSTLVGALPISATPVTSITVATGAGTINKGDVFTIANVFKVHPETKISTGVLQQFTAAADYAGGGGVVSFSPPIVLAGAAQNVVIPVTSATAAIVVLGTASTAVGTSLLYQEGAFGFATADLIMPDGVDWKAREVFDGISMRMIRQYDINSDRFPTRLDVLYGYKTLRPQLAMRQHNN
jgi:P22 coat protein - gene protein 5